MLTPYEQTGTQTSVEAGDAWLDDLVAAHDHVTASTIGASTADDEIRAFTIGTGPARVVVLGAAHGNEPAGREGILAFMRDLAQDTDLSDYLAATAWTFIPTVNPHGLRHNVRRNRPGPAPPAVDLNRDHHAQTQPETQAVAAWLTTTAPHLVLDQHEMTDTAHVADLTTGRQGHDLHHPALITASTALEAHVAAAAQDAGHTWARYAEHPGQTRGTSLNEAGILYHSTALLIETQNQHDRLTLAQRVALHRLTLHAARDYHAAHTAALEDAHQTALAGSILRRTDGTPAVLRRTDGTPAVLHPAP